MKNKRKRNSYIFFHLSKVALVLASLVIYPTHAFSEKNSFFEITGTTYDNKLNNIYSLGMYSSISGKSKSNVYAGMQMMSLEDNSSSDKKSVFKILIGQTFGETFSPFYEIGTDLFGFISLFGNNDTHNCSADEKCSIDFFFRAGIRIRLNDGLVLGIFHENLNFGDFHESLSGEHQYIGGSLGIEF